mgnify:FL=1
MEVDIIVMATGYKQRFPFLKKHTQCAERGVGSTTHTHDDELPPERLICSSDEPTLVRRIAFEYIGIGMGIGMVSW